MFVVAGPPGSGKTTFFPVTALGIDAFSIDDRCAQLVGSYRAIPRAVRSAVAKECERFVLRHIQEGRSFAVETTLRTLVAVRQADAAHKRGFTTRMRFLATATPDTNFERVLLRAQSGGHAASELEVRATYDASLANLAHAIKVFDSCRVYDTSAPWSAPRLVATARGGTVRLQPAPPQWVVRTLPIG